MIFLIIFAWLVSTIFFLGGTCGMILSALLYNFSKTHMALEHSEINMERYQKGIRISFLICALGLFGILALLFFV